MPQTTPQDTSRGIIRFLRVFASRETILQLTTTIMIPLTVAGMGWYYTRWQQSLADLKTMIDLVTDQNAERRKYGVAMFEYLLKNDKVPVEFVSAQIDFANSSADQTLLALMEAAVKKAALANPAAAAAVNEAFQRLPSRLFVHIADGGQRACVYHLLGAMKDNDKVTVAVPSISEGDWGGDVHELRYLKPEDKDRATAISQILTNLGLANRIVDLSVVYPDARHFRPNTFELWLAKAPLPLECQVAAK